MHLSILRTVDISICSLEMELSQVVKLSTVARKRTQVNFKILNILLMILSRRKKKKQDFKRTKCHHPFCCVLHSDVFFNSRPGLPSIPNIVGHLPLSLMGECRKTAVQEATTGSFYTCSVSIKTKLLVKTSVRIDTYTDNKCD